MLRCSVRCGDGACDAAMVVNYRSWGASRGPPLEPQSGISVDLDRLKMETVIGVGMWCEMGMRFTSIGIGTGISNRSATLDVHKVAAQATLARRTPQ